MNFGDECYIVYDKFGGDVHGFKNPLTVDYSIKYLFETVNGLDEVLQTSEANETETKLQSKTNDNEIFLDGEDEEDEELPMKKTKIKSKSVKNVKTVKVPKMIKDDKEDAKIKNPKICDMLYLSGDEAIKKFNGKFANICLPNNLNKEIITIHMFCFRNEKNIEIVITIVGIDIKQMTEYYQLYSEIPNREFILAACRYHICYTGSTAQESSDTIVRGIVDTVMVPKANIIEPAIDQPDFIRKEKQLYNYQKRTIKWMVDTEKKQKKIYYGNNYKFEIEIGPYVYDIILKTLVKKDQRDYIMFRGGALIDEVGLGKTIQTLTLCLLNPVPANKLSYIDEERGMLKSRGTLIICPNQLCGQWTREITNMIERKDLKVVSMLTKNHFNKYTYQDLLDADFVIVSYTFIGNNCFASKYTETLSKSKSYHKSRDWNKAAVEKVLTTMAKGLAEDPASLFQTEPLFPLIFWHRVVVDEFHEAYTVDAYSYVKNILPMVHGTYKWVVTGTPFDKGTKCFNHMMDFITDHTGHIDANYRLFVKDIRNHMTNDFFRRNTKKSVEDEHKLPELREKIIRLRFTRTERAMYNAYKADPNLSGNSEIIRQICCHPKIADEIKGILDNCKTLEDIEKSMVLHYKSQYAIAHKRVKRCEKSIAKTERRMVVIEYKRQRRFLKQSGYKVKIELEPFEFKEVTDPDLAGVAVTVEAELDENGNPLEDGDNGLNFDDDSDDEDEDDDDKPLMTINEENQEKIIKIISKKLRDNPSQMYATETTKLQQQKQRLANLVKICDGKKGSFKFFNNMLEKIKKKTTKLKKKYEKAAAKDKKKQKKGGSDSDSDSSDSSDEEDDEDNCGVCLDTITGEDVGVTKCGHIFHYACLKDMIKSINKCPICSVPQKNSDIFMTSYEKPVITDENAEHVKTKLDMINQDGTKMANLVSYLKEITQKEHVIIFSQWDSLLRKVGGVLSKYGIKNVFCTGNVFVRDKAIREFSSSDDIKVIMLSSQSAASGTNLTRASKVILLDPVSGSYEYRRNTEWQAIGRAYRLGQTQIVEIVRFIIEGTIEEDIYKENKIEDAKQETKLNISVTTDDTIKLTDDMALALSDAAKKYQVIKLEKEKIKKEKLEKKKAELAKGKGAVNVNVNNVEAKVEEKVEAKVEEKVEAKVEEKVEDKVKVVKVKAKVKIEKVEKVEDGVKVGKDEKIEDGVKIIDDANEVLKPQAVPVTDKVTEEENTKVKTKSKTTSKTTKKKTAKKTAKKTDKKTAKKTTTKKTVKKSTKPVKAAKKQSEDEESANKSESEADVGPEIASDSSSDSDANSKKNTKKKGAVKKSVKKATKKTATNVK